MASKWYAAEMLGFPNEGTRFACSGLTKSQTICDRISKIDTVAAKGHLQSLSIIDPKEISIHTPLLKDLATSTLCTGVHRKDELKVKAAVEKFYKSVEEYKTTLKGQNEYAPDTGYGQEEVSAQPELPRQEPTIPHSQQTPNPVGGLEATIQQLRA